MYTEPDTPVPPSPELMVTSPPSAKGANPAFMKISPATPVAPYASPANTLTSPPLPAVAPTPSPA
eukprot:1185541-Prorocentrum_minimum.AAC.2